MEDLEEALGDVENNVDIIIEDDDKLTVSDVEKIKASGKKVNLNYYENNGTLLYSWIVDGSKINDTNEFLTTVDKTSDNESAIKSLIGDVGYLIVNTENNNIPKGTRLKLYVGSIFNNGDSVSLYTYNSATGELNLVQDKISVESSYVLVNLGSGDEYVIVNNPKVSVDNTAVSSSSSLSKIIFVIILLSILAAIIVYIKRKQKDLDAN